ncbi:MAG: hypothetical protein KAU95_00985 [Candidatus Aenigmarchaeota archaeon]|nr:hypothetical protein [Candidatus Aenigmarchaeota archaeon]
MGKNKVNIRFCSPKEYEFYKPDEYGLYYPDYKKFAMAKKDNKNEDPCYPWGMKSIEKAENIITGKMITCCAGGITNSKKAVRYHLVPEKFNLEDIESGDSQLKKRLNNYIDKLEEEENIHGLLLGGDISTLGIKENSKHLFERLTNFFADELNIDNSYFWGQDFSKDSRGMDAYYLSKENTWRILKFNNNSDKVISSVEELKNNLEQVYLAEGDLLFLDEADKGISSKELREELYKC